MPEHALPVARVMGVYVKNVVKARGVYFECLSFYVSVMSGKLITQIWLTD